MKLFAILAAFFVLSVAFTTGPSGQEEGNGKGQGQGKRHVNTMTAADCEALEGTCNAPANCNLTQNFHMAPAKGGDCDGDLQYACCIYKAVMCARMNGSFISDEDCNAKPGFFVTGLHLDGFNCCALEHDDDSNGNGVPRLAGGMNVLMIVVCAYRTL
ncbi:hypothetical protein LSAT2_010252, partial [Lamellibrachia satsuma]